MLQWLLTAVAALGRIEAALQLIEKKVEGKQVTGHWTDVASASHTLGEFKSELIKPAVEESLQASQGCLFSLPDHKEPHLPIDVEEAYVGLTVH